jgi:coproporphyrinogen III oxidase
MEKISRINITKHLVEYELEIVGKTLIDTLSTDKWNFDFTMTRAQLEQFHDYAIPLIKKTFHCNKTKAEETFQWFRSNLGLRLKG